MKIKFTKARFPSILREEEYDIRARVEEYYDASTKMEGYPYRIHMKDPLSDLFFGAREDFELAKRAWADPSLLDTPGGTISSFLIANRSWLYLLVIIILIDHFCFGGALIAKVKRKLSPNL